MSYANLKYTTIYLSKKHSRSFLELFNKATTEFKDSICLPININQKQIKNLSTVLTLSDVNGAFFDNHLSNIIFKSANTFSKESYISKYTDFILIHNSKSKAYFLLGEVILNLLGKEKEISLPNLKESKPLKKLLTHREIKVSNNAKIKITKSGKTTSSSFPISHIKKLMIKRAFEIMA